MAKYLTTQKHQLRTCHDSNVQPYGASIIPDLLGVKSAGGTDDLM